MSPVHGRPIIYAPPPPPHETIYDLLRAFCGAIPWRDEEQRRKYEKLIGDLEAVAVFGTTAERITTNMSEDGR